MSRRWQVKSASILNQPDLFSTVMQAQAIANRFETKRDAKSSEQEVAEPSATRAARRQLDTKPAPEFRSRHLLDVRAAAAWLGLSKSTLDKMRHYGTGPRYIRATSRAVRYDPDDLRAYVEARSQSPTDG